MPCENPLEAFRPALGGPVRFTPPTDGRAYIPTKLPCGICILCQEEKARQWAVRIHHETQLHERNCFLTLTYSDEYLPKYNSLDYQDLSNFIKRLRQQLVRQGGNLKYFAVGEYGDITKRPHYHICIFGHDFADGAVIAQEQPHRLWISPFIEKLWGEGKTVIGTLNYQTARYTASYVQKKLVAKQRYVRIDEQTGELVPLEQPDSRMSRNIAKGWWEQFGRQDEELDLVYINGTKGKPPRAYDRWLATTQPTRAEEIKEERRKKATHSTKDQGRARAQNTHARLRSKTRTV